MTGKLYVIGVGPGDPELLTLKSVKILREVSCICVPKGREEGSSLALSIVKQVVGLEGKEIIEAYFPMRKTKQQGSGVRGQGLEKNHSSDCKLDAKWNETVEAILSRLSKGTDTAFVTIGDPTIYSTYFYLHDRLLELNPGISIEIIPGVSSINTAAARAGLFLGIADERIAILPANYPGDLKKTVEQFDAIVLMKVHKVFDKVLNMLNEMNLTGNAVYISRAGMEDEKIFHSITDVKEDDLNYFSMVIIKK
ncbi:MAG: precorrin-2 C(20)-methyltransferase [Nitrospira bacterium HGW-Nitrospira-1]|nr:MAG: precorrin-2 C(20)-methyltransferase [Nitrospira bacterium HGW-Nitrospira-1]